MKIISHAFILSYRLVEQCETIGGASPNVDCVFPFIFDNKVHYSCIYDSSTDGHPWCSTKVDENGLHISQEGHWGHCSNSCPVSSRGNLVF